MTDKWSLDALPTDVLLIIFDYCNVVDLSRLDSVCKRFHLIISDDTTWIKKSYWPLVTNQFSKRFRERCDPILPVRKKWQVSHNWIRGKYSTKIIATDRVNSLPWICLTKDILWWSTGSALCGYTRRTFKKSKKKPSNPSSKSNRVYSWLNITGDICKFVVRDDYIISGHRDGKIWFWSITEKHSDNFNYGVKGAHSSSINAIDEIPEAIISGGSDGTIKIWPRNLDVQDVRPISVNNISDRIWSLGADPGRQKFAVGSSGTNDGPPLRVFDIEYSRETSIFEHDWKYGAGTLDLVWENSDCLLSCGYDTYIKKWDLRTGKCVASWADPTDATVYCLASDYKHTMLSGTQYNGKSVLWDQRHRKYIQLYFMNFRATSSPVYSISFNSTHIYAATDRQLVEFSFLGNHKETKDYRYMIN